MAITKPPVLPPWADTATPETDIVQPTDLEISAGWPSSTTPPSRQRFNWILNFVANAVRYFSRRGIADYDAAETYQTGDIVRGDNGRLYRSVQDNNTNHLPSAVLSAWWGSVETVTPAGGDNSNKIATTAYVQTSISGKANTNGTYSSMTVGNATNAANAALAASAGSVPWAGVTGRPTTVGGYGITDAITTGNIAFQSVNYANSAGRAYPYRWDGTPISIVWSGQAGQPNWLLGSNNGTDFYVYNPANFSVNFATNAANATTQAAGTSNASIATTAFACPGFSHGANGYDRLPSGLFIQWGLVTGGAGIGAVFLTFPITFPNACYAVVCSSANRSTSGQFGSNYASNVSNSGAVLTLDQNVNGVRQGYWYAIGR